MDCHVLTKRGGTTFSLYCRNSHSVGYLATVVDTWYTDVSINKKNINLHIKC